MKSRNKAITAYKHCCYMHKRQVTIQNLKRDIMKVILDYNEFFPSPPTKASNDLYSNEFSEFHLNTKRIERLNDKERRFIKWLESQITTQEFRKAYQFRNPYKNNAQKRRKRIHRNSRNSIRKTIYKELKELVPSYNYHNEVSLFGRTLTSNERKRYFGNIKHECCHMKHSNCDRTKPKENSVTTLRIKQRYIKTDHRSERSKIPQIETAWTVEDRITAQKQFNCLDLQHGWTIDSGASAHMTPFKTDCQHIHSVYKEVYLADGTKILCKQMGQIIIPITSKNGITFCL